MKFKRFTIISLIVIAGFLVFILPTLAAEDTNKQTIDIKVLTNESETNPKVAWYQLDNGYFRADYDGSNNQPPPLTFLSFFILSSYWLFKS